jgi:signal transduction histidine kinase
MSSSSAQVISFVIIISSLLLIFFSCIIIRYIFLYQQKRYRHKQEVIELREVFNQELMQSKLAIQEQTLDHIAKELHANCSHLVSLININLSEILPQSSGETKESVLETKAMAKQLLSELKELSASLNTDHIMHIGFSNALKNELNRTAKLKKNVFTFTITGEEYRLKSQDEIILFRLCQEILNNIVKYAKAKSVNVLLAYSPDNFKLEIADDGIGFDIDAALINSAEKQSTGLINIKKRAKLINADVTIESEIGKGSKFVITILQNGKLIASHDS